MGIYPKKKKVMAGRFGFDTSKIKAGLDTNEAIKTGAGIGGALEGAVSNIGKKDLGYGVEHQGVGAATAGKALGTGAKFAEAGLKMGGPWGAVIGGAVGFVGGGIAGAVGSSKAKNAAEKQFKINMSTELNKQAKSSRTNYAGIGGYKAQAYKNGGTLSATDKAVIMGGKLHKDGGNPIVTADNGKKIAETEREELMLTSEQTDMVEKYISSYDKKASDTILEKLGMEVQNLLLNNTIDNSGLYGL